MTDTAQKGRERPARRHRSLSHGPGSKYHKTRIYSSDGTYVGIVIWDGITNYTNEPPIPNIVIAEKLAAETLTIIQVPDDWEDGEARFQLGIEASYDGSDVIFFAKRSLGLPTALPVHRGNE